MHKFYFTFGSWERFPYQDGYMIVIAENQSEAIAAFRKKYPDIVENTINCSDYYTEDIWNRFSSKYYIGKEPKEILYANPSLERELENFSVVLHIFGLTYELENGKIILYDKEENPYLEKKFESTVDVLKDSLFDDLFDELDAPHVDFSEYGRCDYE